MILNDREIDKRIIEKMIQTGTITEEEIKTYLDSLPDVSDNAEEVVIDMERKRK
jgi:hypothetical protein